MVSRHAATLVLLGVTITWVGAQLPFIGKCPTQSVVQNFNVQSYLGKWYEQEKFFAIFQAGGKCVTAIYSDQGNGVVGVNNSQIQIKNGRQKTIQGTAVLSGSSGEAKLSVRFPTSGNNPAPYWVLDTDYTSYAIVWSCVDVLGFVNAQFLWVLTRDKIANPATITTVHNILNQRKLDISRLQKTTQDCNN